MIHFYKRFLIKEDNILVKIIISSMGNLDKEIELELLEIKEENPNFSINIQTIQYFLANKLIPSKQNNVFMTCLHLILRTINLILML